LTTLDILIPVFNESNSIVPVLDGLKRGVKTAFRVLICYDFEADTTLPAVRGYDVGSMSILLVRNKSSGPHAAVVSGFRASSADAALVFPADDTYNIHIIDQMVQLFDEGCDIVAASRFMPGGRMEGCPWLKSILVRTAAFTLYTLGRIPTHDPTNGFRLFSRRVHQTIAIESSQGFTYSLELLVKAHRLGWKIGEVPALWFERTPAQGKSRFKVLKWLPAYLPWYFYAFVSTYAGRWLAR
jgi:glycosyltransferase involved in cell wall biosynthesis